jgi:hypothetical protein
MRKPTINSRPAPLDIHGNVPIEEQYDLTAYRREIGMTKAVNNRITNEKVPFRHIQTSCCGILLCWINPRRPMYCPECGKRIFHQFPKNKWENTFAEAWLRVQDYQKAEYNCNEVALDNDLKAIIVNYHTDDGE